MERAARRNSDPARTSIDGDDRCLRRRSGQGDPHAAQRLDDPAAQRQLQDRVIRSIADQGIGQLGGATIIVDNKPGAAGAIAADVVLGARDGHTLLTFSDSLLTTALINKSARYQPLRDFRMLSLLCDGTLVLLAAPNAPFRDFSEFVA